MSRHSRPAPAGDAPLPDGGAGDPFAIVETGVPVPPVVAAVDLPAAFADAVVTRGKLEDRLAEATRAGDARLRKLATDLLPVADALEAAIGMAGSEPEKATATALRRLLARALARHGVERVDVVGRVADPDLVDVDGSEPAGTLPPETVVRELVAAYRLHGVVLRRGVVVVAD